MLDGKGLFLGVVGRDVCLILLSVWRSWALSIYIMTRFEPSQALHKQRYPPAAPSLSLLLSASPPPSLSFFLLLSLIFPLSLTQSHPLAPQSSQSSHLPLPPPKTHKQPPAFLTIERGVNFVVLA